MVEPGPRWTRTEFKGVVELLLDLLSRHEAAGPRLRSLDMAARIVFSDLGLVLHLRPADAKRLRRGHNLSWSWKTRDGRPPAVVVELTSEVANRCAQGRENIPLAVARGTIGLEATDRPADRETALDVVPVLVSLQRPWASLLRERGFHRFIV